jgi:hypothetical protein
MNFYWPVLWIRNDFFFPDPDPTLALISDPEPGSYPDPDSGLFMKNTFEMHLNIGKKLIF